MTDSFTLYLRNDGDPRLLGLAALVENAKVLLDIPEETLRELAADLISYPGFLSDEALRHLVIRRVADEEQVKRLNRLLKWLARYPAVGANTSTEILDKITRWQAETGNQELQLLSADELGQLRKLIPLLVLPNTGLVRQAKAERLAAATGLQAEAIDLICDLRPVFDDSRTQLEGVIPYTTLKVVASGVDKFPVSFEAILSAQDVQLLLKKAEDVVQKLNALGQLAEKNRLAVPAVRLTETSD